MVGKMAFSNLFVAIVLSNFDDDADEEVEDEEEEDEEVAVPSSAPSPPASPPSSDDNEVSASGNVDSMPHQPKSGEVQMTWRFSSYVRTDDDGRQVDGTHLGSHSGLCCFAQLPADDCGFARVPQMQPTALPSSLKSALPSIPRTPRMGAVISHSSSSAGAIPSAADARR